ncbi:MAG: ABC transporter permease [Planctomycetota bacterium]
MDGGASFEIDDREADGLVVCLSGRLDSTTTGGVWPDVLDAAKGPPDRLVVDATDLTYLDGVGAGLLVELQRRQRKAGKEFELTGLADDLRGVLDLFPATRFDATSSPRRDLNPISQIGKRVVDALVDFRFQVAFIGEATVELLGACLRPGRVRWRDVMRILEQVGVDSVPVICVIGLLFGLILAFSFVAFLLQFGAELMTASGVAYATFRELGPIMTAIILAGRSGSAFAAEIGTMKVNEEVDALTTMGLKPMRFLVVPRVIAAMIATPLLTLFMVLLALAGSAAVIMAYDYPFVTYVQKVTESVKVFDLSLCLIKGVLFGLLIAATGCLRGLQTGKGAMSVGISATRAVVSSIVVVILVDGIIVVVLFALGLQ